MQSHEDPTDTISANLVGSIQGTHGNALLDSFGITDVLSSGTLQLFKSDKRLFSDVLQATEKSLPSTRDRMLDMGCGYGALSHLLGDSLRFKEIFGIDFDESRASVASQRGLKTFVRDIGEDRFPFADGYFDFATSFGVLDHIKNIDNPISEMRRVVKPRGCVVISTTNLSSWVNRLVLLLGYQPRNLEISKKGLFGVHALYKHLYSCTEPMARISSITLRALEEFLNFNGFSILKRWGTGLIPSPDRDPGALMKTVDKFLSKRPSLAVRYIILAKKMR